MIWKRKGGESESVPSERQQALAVLGLRDPVMQADILLRYRRLVMQHHPDRGGGLPAFLELQNAIKVLGRGRVRRGRAR